MKQLIKKVFPLLMAIILLSCARQSGANLSELENEFSKVVPLNDINKSLQIDLEGQDTSFESNADISILIHNRSRYSIYFDNGSYVKLLISPDQLQWLDVMNDMEYYGTMIASPQGTPLLDFVHAVVRPSLDQSVLAVGNTDVLLRIVVIGEILEGEIRTGKNVGAYLDVTLRP